MLTSHLLWIALVAANLVIQTLCLFRDENRSLFLANKLTTPLLPFSAFLILWYRSGTPFSVASIILLAMGVGEIGLEGSQIMTSEGRSPSVSDSLVLIRMGAGLDKFNPRDRRVLFVLMVVILLLYHVYMGVLISTWSPFPARGSQGLPARESSSMSSNILLSDRPLERNKARSSGGTGRDWVRLNLAWLEWLRDGILRREGFLERRCWISG